MFGSIALTGSQLEHHYPQTTSPNNIKTIPPPEPLNEEKSQTVVVSPEPLNEEPPRLVVAPKFEYDKIGSWSDMDMDTDIDLSKSDVQYYGNTPSNNTTADEKRPNIIIENYSEIAKNHGDTTKLNRSIKLSGKDIFDYISYFDTLNVKYNKNLYGGPGYIVSNKYEGEIQKIYNDIISKNLPPIPRRKFRPKFVNTSTINHNLTGNPIPSNAPIIPTSHNFVSPQIGDECDIKVPADKIYHKATVVGYIVQLHNHSPNVNLNIIKHNNKFVVANESRPHYVNFKKLHQ